MPPHKPPSGRGDGSRRRQGGACVCKNRNGFTSSPSFLPRSPPLPLLPEEGQEERRRREDTILPYGGLTTPFCRDRRPLFAPSSRLIRRLRRHLLPPEKATLRPFLRFVSFVGEDIILPFFIVRTVEDACPYDGLIRFPTVGADVLGGPYIQRRK